MFPILAIFVQIFSFVVCFLSLTLASHGVRQRNSSVPLREVVDTSKSHATALISPIQGPARRQAVLGLDDCPFCDPKKCANPREEEGRAGICVAIKEGNGLPIVHRCLSSRKELNRALRNRQMPLARDRLQGCERTETVDELEQEVTEELCWCQAVQQKSLLDEGLANQERAYAIHHARRRKNHHPQKAQTNDNKNGQLPYNDSNPQQRSLAGGGSSSSDAPGALPNFVVVVGAIVAAITLPIIPFAY